MSSALTTGFSDDNVYFKYNKGNHQFSFDYSINVRNYRDWIEDNQYSFTLDDQQAVYDYHLHKRFGYTDNKFNLKYAYSKPDDVTFQVTFRQNCLISSTGEIARLQRKETRLGRMVSETRRILWITRNPQ